MPTSADVADRFAGKNVGIIGCATGLGRGMALAFAQEGASLALADIDPVPLEALAVEARTFGVRVTTQRLDVSSDEEVAGFAAAVRRDFSHLDIICCNAGVSECPGPVWEATPADWQWVMGVNLQGFVSVTRHFLPMMMEQGFGRLVSTGSNSALAAPAGVGIYAASKSALLGFCEALQHDLRAAGSSVKVSVVIPRRIISDMANSARSRPASLPGRVPTAAQIAEMRAYQAKGGMTGAEAAPFILDGIAEDRFFILTSMLDAAMAGQWAAQLETGELHALHTYAGPGTLK